MLTVTALARECGTTPHTVRYYSRPGLLREQRHPDNEYRLFDDAEQARLRFILQARELGYSLKEIRAILEDADRGEPLSAGAPDPAGTHRGKPTAHRRADAAAGAHGSGNEGLGCDAGRDPGRKFGLSSHRILRAGRLSGIGGDHPQQDTEAIMDVMIVATRQCGHYPSLSKELEALNVPHRVVFVEDEPELAHN